MPIKNKVLTILKLLSIEIPANFSKPGGYRLKDLSEKLLETYFKVSIKGL